MRSQVFGGFVQGGGGEDFNLGFSEHLALVLATLLSGCVALAPISSCWASVSRISRMDCLVLKNPFDVTRVMRIQVSTML